MAKTLFSHRTITPVKFSLLLALVAGLSACASTKQLQESQAALQQCLVNHSQQAAQDAQQNQAIVASLGQLQEQLQEQQKILETKPQVIEMPVTKVICPRITPPAPKLPPAETPVMDKLIVGLREQALLTGLDIVVPTRISTSVANSVLDARNIQMFERNGEEWVRFTVYNPDTKEPHVLERKRLRFQTVATSANTNDKRPVVEMRFTLGKLTQKGEFILADRSHSEFPLLIGRNILRDVMLVDVSGNNLAPVQRIEDAAANPAKPAQ